MFTTVGLLATVTASTAGIVNDSVAVVAIEGFVVLVMSTLNDTSVPGGGTVPPWQNRQMPISAVWPGGIVIWGTLVPPVKPGGRSARFTVKASVVDSWFLIPTMNAVGNCRAQKGT